MVNVPVSASLWCRWRDAWVGPKKKKCNPSLPSTGQQPSFSLEEMWNQRRTSLKEATVLRQEGTTGSRLNKVVALGGQNWCVKRKPSPSKVAAQPHTYSTARCTMGLSDRSLEKKASCVWALQTKRVHCFASLSLYNQGPLLFILLAAADSPSMSKKGQDCSTAVPKNHFSKEEGKERRP